MKQEKSCGIIPYIMINNEIHYVLIKQNNDFVCFPKGHVEAGESEEQTALRECYEETHLKQEIVKCYKAKKKAEDLPFYKLRSILGND